MVYVTWKYFPINNLLFPAICDNLVRVHVWGHMVHSDMEILSNHQFNISYICDHFEWVDAWGHVVHVTQKYYSINNSILLDVIESLEWTYLCVSASVCPKYIPLGILKQRHMNQNDKYSKWPTTQNDLWETTWQMTQWKSLKLQMKITQDLQ